MDPDYIKLKDIKSELSSYLSDALTLLKENPVPDDNAVHNIRVLLKRSRAVLKLIETQIESEYKEKDIISLKEAAGLMTSWRDSTVYRKTLKELKKEYPGLFNSLKENTKLTTLLEKNEPVAEPDPKMKQGIEHIEDLLKKTAYRIRFLNMKDFDPVVLLKELDKTYNNAIDHFLICRNNPEESKLHEFRKKCKDFLYQLFFFRPLNSPEIKALEKKLEILTHNLGKINDISQIVKALGYNYPNEFNSPELDELIVHMREYQDDYLQKVWPAATKIFSPGRKLVNVLGYKILVI
ncbi:MAG TPA: CHAD domain-containing protein [Bacteroidales bacterium]|nr:CHAD domain-containing protein [Bacteroidales bacterium]